MASSIPPNASNPDRPAALPGAVQGQGATPPSPPTGPRWALEGPSTEKADSPGLQGLAGDSQLGRGLLKPGEAREVCPALN